MIDIRKLKELVRLMVHNDLTELDLRDSEEQVTLRREGKQVQQMVPMQMPVPAAHAVPGAPTQAAPQTPPATEAAEAESDEGLIAIESPMVGTFYSAPNPDTPPFVEVGARVNTDTVVCLVEAMKIFNEIKAEQSGVVQKVCVKNGAAVEFGEPLFLIKPE